MSMKELLKEKNYKEITLEEMKLYIEENTPAEELAKEKAEFKKIVEDTKTTKGSYNHIAVVRAFCDKYFPGKLPVAKPKKEKVSDSLLNW